MIGNIAAAAIIVVIALVAIGVVWKVPRHQGAAVAAVALVVIAVWTWVPQVSDTITSHTPGTLVGAALGLALVYAYRWHEARQRSAPRR